MRRIINWLFALFDSRSEFEKQEDAKLISNIKKISETHHIIVGGRGGIRKIRKDNNAKQ